MGNIETVASARQLPKNSHSLSGDGAQAKAHELFDRLVALESHLADPRSVAAVGRAYARLTEWTKEHLWDNDLQEVLEWLQPDPIYPTWRRQALEEAYRLFYDDAVKTGDAEIIANLPEPPTSEEIGFRQLPEALMSGAASRAPLFTGTYEDKSVCPLNRRRWEYEIRRTEAKNGWASGREIVAKGSTQKQQPTGGPCAADYMQQLALALLPAEQCCARREEARRARGPFFLPEGPRAPPRRPPGAVVAAARGPLGATGSSPYGGPGATPGRDLLRASGGRSSWPAPRDDT